VSRSSPEGDDRSLVERSVHDLLNPVSSILGFGETLRARGASLGDETIRGFGASIARQATRLEKAVRDLSLASRLLREDLTPAFREVAIGDLLTPFASDRVGIEAPRDLIVRADQELLVDAVGRLVENALAFSDADVALKAGASDRVWIEVGDRGMGFDADGLESAFDPLAAGRNARNERGDGLGLGLFIARRLVELQGGALTGTSSPGKGSVFRIELRR